MRNAELTSGIEVYSDETSEVYGSSQAAAKEAIGLTVIIIIQRCEILTDVFDRYGSLIHDSVGKRFAR